MDTPDTQPAVNALPITSFSNSNVVRSLEKSSPMAYEYAIAEKRWDDICASRVPSSALEIFCIHCIDNSLDEAECIALLKEVKKHLIHLNVSVLQAFEKRMLADAVRTVNYRAVNFKPRGKSRQQPHAEEDGWEGRMEKAEAMIRSLQGVVTGPNGEIWKRRGRRPNWMKEMESKS
jgi:hypothetical protein